MKAVHLLKIKRVSLYFISKTRFYFSKRTELGSCTGVKRCWNPGPLAALHFSLHKMNSPLIFSWGQEVLPMENNHPGQQPTTNLRVLKVPTAKSKRNLSQHLRDRWVRLGGVRALQHCSSRGFALQELIPDDSAIQMWYRSHHGHVTASTKLDTAHDPRPVPASGGMLKDRQWGWIALKTEQSSQPPPSQSAISEDLTRAKWWASSELQRWDVPDQSPASGGQNAPFGSWKLKARGAGAAPQGSRWCWQVWPPHGEENSYKTYSALPAPPLGLRLPQCWRKPKQSRKKKALKNPSKQTPKSNLLLVHSRLFFIPLITATNVLLSLEENVVIPQSDVFTFTSIIAWYILTLVKSYVF